MSEADGRSSEIWPTDDVSEIVLSKPGVTTNGKATSQSAYFKCTDMNTEVNDNPLGLEIECNGYQWSYAPLYDFFILEYKVKKVGDSDPCIFLASLNIIANQFIEIRRHGAIYHLINYLIWFHISITSRAHRQLSLLLTGQRKFVKIFPLTSLHEDGRDSGFSDIDEVILRWLSLLLWEIGEVWQGKRGHSIC